MNDEVKEILIDVVDYYDSVGTEDDDGILASVALRSRLALERHSKQTTQTPQTTKAVDPFTAYDEFPDTVLKLEDEW